MLQGVFLASRDRISVKIKYRLKQDIFHQISNEDFIPLGEKMKIRLEEGQDLIQKN